MRLPLLPLPYMLIGVLPDFPVLQTRDEPVRCWAIAATDTVVPPFYNVAAAPLPSWRAPPSFDESIMAMAKAFSKLWKQRLTFSHVMEDFIRRRLASLKARKTPAWEKGSSFDSNSDDDGKPCSSSLCDVHLGFFFPTWGLCFSSFLELVQGCGPRWTRLG